MRSAVFITPESLLSKPRPSLIEDPITAAPAFCIASQAVLALKRLKEAGFIIIGIVSEELFNGFASPRSCREFLSATKLDDVMIARQGTEPDRSRNLLIQAAAKWLLDLDRSFIIGRGEEISGAGLTGCTPVLIGPPGEEALPREPRPLTLRGAVERILAYEPPPTPITRV